MQIIVRLGDPPWRAAGALRLYLDFDEGDVTVADLLAPGSHLSPFRHGFSGGCLGRRCPIKYSLMPGWCPWAVRPSAPWSTATKSISSCRLSAARRRCPAVLLRDTLLVARVLLGARLVRMLDGQRAAGRIVEVEVYIGEDDLASHAARAANATGPCMGPEAFTYVYFIYGMHYRLNVVTETDGFPAAVLIRGILPLEGSPMAARGRGSRCDP